MGGPEKAPPTPPPPETPPRSPGAPPPPPAPTPPAAPDGAGRAGGPRGVLGGGEVVAVVDLPVHLAALVDVGASLREVGEDLRVARLREGPLPERRRGRPGADLALRRLRLLALLTVDDEEAVEQRLRRRPLRQQLGHLGL